jgi:hypothetical protein
VVELFYVCDGAGDVCVAVVELDMLHHSRIVVYVRHTLVYVGYVAVLYTFFLHI